MYILNVTRETVGDARYGIRKSLEPVVGELKKQGHRVEIFDQQKANDAPSGKFVLWLEKIYLSVIYLRFGENSELARHIFTERMAIGRKAAGYASKKGVTHVHCHDPLLAYAYQFFSRFYGSTKCIGYKATAFGRFVKPRLGINIDEKSLSVLQKLEAQAESKARWVFLTTNSGMKQMQQDLGKEKFPKHWHLVPNPVIVAQPNRSVSRKKLGIADNEKLLVAAGQLIPMKRFDLLLQSVALIPGNIRPRIIILGDGPEKVSLYELAKKSGIHNFEIRVANAMDEYYAAADLYVSTSSTESFGMANCEALLAGLPSVCTKVDAVPELLKDGAMLTGDDPQEIATAIQKILTDNSMRENLKRKALMVTSGWATREQIANKIEEILDQCK
ncbi:MAG: glycosyltransferase family 4 protein [Bacteroidales bacterium]